VFWHKERTCGSVSSITRSAPKYGSGDGAFELKNMNDSSRGHESTRKLRSLWLTKVLTILRHLTFPSPVDLDDQDNIPAWMISVSILGACWNRSANSRLQGSALPPIISGPSMCRYRSDSSVVDSGILILRSKERVMCKS
jgi:hypothetical protein